MFTIHAFEERLLKTKNKRKAKALQKSIRIYLSYTHHHSVRRYDLLSRTKEACIKQEHIKTISGKTNDN